MTPSDRPTLTPLSSTVARRAARWQTVRRTLSVTALTGAALASWTLAAANQGATNYVSGPVIIEVEPAMVPICSVALPALEKAPDEISPDKQAPAEPLVGSDFAFVTELDDTSYLVLGADSADTEADVSASTTKFDIPIHDVPRLLGGTENPQGWLATVRHENVPTNVASWLGREVVLDSGCRARVDGFAVLGLMFGSVGYMSFDERELNHEQLVTAILGEGTKVLAARLDGCKGEFAVSSETAVAKTETNDAIANKARRALLATRHARDAQAAWTEAGETGNWFDNEWTSIEVKLVRNPTTGVLHASVHATSGIGCGGPNINIWAFYDVNDDELTERWVVPLDSVISLDQALDIDGDGELEWYGGAYYADRVFITTSDAGPRIERRLSIPFFGCPC